jgi:hypothetical protein
MYLFESTSKLVNEERQDLLRTQFDMLTVKVDGIRQWEGGRPLLSTDLLPTLLREVGVPQQVSHHKVADFEGHRLGKIAADVKESAFAGQMSERKYVDHSYGLSLTGVPSTGKTSLAAALLRYAAWNAFTIKFIDIEKFAKFHTTWIELSSNGDKYEDYDERADDWRRELWRLYFVYDFLVLDDVCRTKVPEFIYGEVHTLLRERAANGVFTIITANKNSKEMGEYLGTSSEHFIKREFITYGFAETEVVDYARE